MALRLSDISAIREAIQEAKGAVHTLWTDNDSEYDCGADDDSDSQVVLTPGKYDKLGSVHCGVPSAGFVAAGGDVFDLEDGHGVLFTRTKVVVCRKGDEHIFTRFADL